MKIKAPAKINLTLDVMRRLPNGYHELKTVFQAVDLCDELKFKSNDSRDIGITSNSDQIPLDENNIAYKAADLLREKYGVEKGIDIHIEKKIPVAAGIAGGSTDAGATFKALNEIWELSLSQEDLMKLGTEIGMDVAFTIMGGTALGTHFGEKLEPIKNKLELNIITVTPELAVFTKEAYEGLDLAVINQNSAKTDRAVKAIEAGDLSGLIENLHNDFEQSIILQHPAISEIKEKMIELGALGSLMSGSGPSVFGVWEDEKEAEKAVGILKKKYRQS